MPQVTYTTVQANEVITAANTNAVFTAVEDATDGTTGKIDPDNTGTGAITRQHLGANEVYQNHNAVDNGSVTSGTVRSSGINSAATAWTLVATLPITGTPTFNVNEAVLRYAFNLLIGDVTTSGGSIYKAQQVYYLKVVLEYNDGGGVLETDVSPFFGYGLAQRSSNDATTSGSEGDVVSAWTRNPLTGIIINRTASRQYISLKLYFKLNVNDGGTANTVETCHYHSYCFAEFL